MRKIEAQMIVAIRRTMGRAEASGTVFRSGNTVVSQFHHGDGSCNWRTIEIRLHGNRIAMIEPDCNRISLWDCGWQSTTTKSRLNALLGAFVPGERITQRQFRWELSNESWTGSDEFPIRLDADNWVLKQAEKLAA